MDPGVDFGGGHSEGDCREVCEAGVFIDGVEFGAVVSLRVAGGDGVEDIEGADFFVGGEVGDLDFAV